MFGSSAPQLPQIAAAELEGRLRAGATPLVLDVREPAEYSRGHIPGSRLMPLGTLPAGLQDLPRDREIVVVCHSGARSSRATQHLVQAGFQAINMVGGMVAWRGPVEH